MNRIYKILFFTSIIISAITGQIKNMDLVILNSVTKAIKIIYTQGISIVLWSGFLNILINQPFCERLSNFFLPIINLVFPNLDFGSKAKMPIVTNFICNLFGIGAAATPSALLAIKELKKENDYFTIMNLTLLNTTSMSIIPLSLISFRKTIGGIVSFKLLLTYFTITIFSITLVIVINNLQKKKIFI